MKRICLFLCALSSWMIIFLANAAAQSTLPLTQLTQRLQRALVNLPGYTVFDYVTFRIVDGHILLVGEVIHPQVKQEAEQAVRSIPGVSAVENDIQILPPSSADDAIRQKVYNSIYNDPQFSSYAIQVIPLIHIIIKQGQVTLEGTVNNSFDRFMAETAVRNTLEGSIVEDHLLALSGDIEQLPQLSMR
jgi:osmotically-inducible protein OsmY